MSRATKDEKAQAVATLRELLPPGSRVHCVARSVSRSGMSRRLDFYKLGDSGPRWLSGYIAQVLDYTHPVDSKRDGLRVDGCGMDMGFHVVSTLSRVLYPDGFGCIGEGCPSNDHSNGDRDYTPAGTIETGGCMEQTCWCHVDKHPVGFTCSSCGCIVVERAHWHKAGDYAIESRWL